MVLGSADVRALLYVEVRCRGVVVSVVARSMLKCFGKLLMAIKVSNDLCCLPSCACNAVCLPSFLLPPYPTPSSFPPFASSNPCVLVRVLQIFPSDVVLFVPCPLVAN